jgi:nucleoside-diphosphate-sugar epimerase/glycosyltransferase involved in cell wall biosynthesis
MIDTHETKLSLSERIARLQGPILVLGGSGFVGANLARMLLAHRPDVYATASRLPAWRLDDLPVSAVRQVDLLVDPNLDALLNETRPRTVFNCVAYGAYSFETDPSLIYQTNFNLTAKLLRRLVERGLSCYVHAGTSSEYGDNASGPSEDAANEPNSDYAVSKVAAANLIYFYGKKKNFPCANLRLYSVYGPLEDSSRLIPNVIRHGIEGTYPPLVDHNISRDFIYVDDVSESFIDTALNLRAPRYGESFNIGAGRKTTIGDIAAIARNTFNLTGETAFTMPARDWDVKDWFANIEKAREVLGWAPRTPFDQGLAATAQWYQSLPDKERYQRSSKRFGLDTRHSVSAIIACYKDGQAIPIMYQRLRDTFTKLNVDYEIIFVNDCSPDDSEEVIRRLSRDNRRVIGISHSRNFGSQAAFRSGMEVARMNSVVLLDGDLQDPPELIEQFVGKWREGFDVVYGRRVKREATLFMQVSYKLFYRVFDYFSYLPIPHDAGDFSLMDKRVVSAINRFPERDLFLRGVRAFAGFKQTGVDYVRPERMFGVTTNSLLKNVGWAKKGILSFSNAPLNMLSSFGLVMLLLSVLLGVVQITVKLLYPKIAVPGATTVLLFILFFGAVNVFAMGLLGEYIAKIFEEVKQRPLFVRRSLVRDGEVRSFGEEAPTMQGRS